jgi:hypothetical protein
MPNEPTAQPQTPSAQPVNPDSAAIVGGPGQETPPAGTVVTQSGVQFVIDGREFVVDPNLAQALQAREQGFNRKLSETSQELGELRKLRQQVAQPPPAQPTQPAQPDIATLLFTDPAQALAIHEQQIMAKISQAYQADVNQRKFWADFYADNDDLDPAVDDKLVKVVMQENYTELNSLPLSDARKKLADLTRHEILRLTQRNKQPTQPGGPMVEPASPRTPQVPQPETQQPVRSLTDLIMAKRAQRTNGRRPAA